MLKICKIKPEGVLQAWVKYERQEKKLWPENFEKIRSFLVKFMGRKIENFQIFSKVFQEVL